MIIFCLYHTKNIEKNQFILSLVRETDTLPLVFKCYKRLANNKIRHKPNLSIKSKNSTVISS